MSFEEITFEKVSDRLFELQAILVTRLFNSPTIMVIYLTSMTFEA